MAKPKKGPAFQLRPKRIAAFDALLGDDFEEASSEAEGLDFLSENSANAIDFLEKGEVNVVDLVESALEQRTLVPRDLKFDDSSMPKAKNFLDWCTNPKFLKAEPYLEQAMIGLRLFGEICVRCSPNLQWMYTENHEPQEGTAAIGKHLHLLHNGVCPHCGARRSDMIRNKEINFYNELAVNAGQRCVIASTPVATNNGIMPIGHMMIGHDTPGFHKPRRNFSAHNGREIKKVSQVYVSSESPTKVITLANGIWIEATHDHPIRTETGFKKTDKLVRGERVEVAVGTNTWGKIQRPTTIYEAGLSTREDALRYIADRSIPFGESKLQYVSEDVDAIQMVWSILLNAGFVPSVLHGGEGYSVLYSLTDEPQRCSKHIEIMFVEEGTPQITYDLQMEGLPQFVASGLVHHNSGKSVVVAMISTYLTHRLLMSQSPTGILSIDSTTVLHGTFVALTQKQAADTLWTPYFNYIMGSPWFQAYHDLIRKHERRYGIEVMKIRDTFILYGHRSFVIYPAGPDGRILRGRTRVLAVIDEVAYFDNDAQSKKIKVSANAVYGALDRSLATVRAKEKRQVEAGYDEAFTGYFCNISSPVHARDKINELMRMAVDSKTLLGIHAPTWKMNPDMPRDSEFLLEAFRRDPVGAARDYGAEAPLSANPFITQPIFIEQAIRDKGRSLCSYTHHILRHKDGQRQRYGSLVKAVETNKNSILAIDAGYSNNSFSLVTGSRDEAGIISVDCVVEIIPKPGIPLNYTMIFDELLVPLCRLRNVRVMLADQWQSLKLLQDAKIKCPSIEAADKYSLKYEDMWTVKTMFESQPSRISLPRMGFAKTIQETLQYNGDEYPHCFENKPTEHLVMQLQTVQDTGRGVIKNTGATDDLWRAMALMVYGFECGEYEEFLSTPAKISVNRDPNRLGRVAGRLNKGVAGSSGKTAPTRVLGSAATRMIGRK
ncbi:hypothetical protein pEaSNUABM34_00004 [Erwinia phage pEa_SNUABM_34]|uniref:Uncharacterized protein n=1 Tax=Erwinia phage pEa_SNUABM_7 TaxID=2866695 RepID=A0AAE7WS27_9CAUD|nr:terminase large subunit [Erwinia phage pEa_SNUABM_7]QYW03306.1 hypothetical protein pEaSNUABM34_00004 [Erwinia phage pEa_SNUABM_34]QYW04672.1 hypothetical protein pEaSNUABM7_00004 [Erwinia phage pEa_SNUABM_7]QYW05018.1 hypothetical protein pEaSNUABM21_00004 [Erwinia phage pEa_SNUABM_21]